MKRKLYVIQFRRHRIPRRLVKGGWIGGWDKWKWDTDYSGFDKFDVECRFMENYNDPIGNTRLTDIKDSVRIKSITVELL